MIKSHRRRKPVRGPGAAGAPAAPGVPAAAGVPAVTRNPAVTGVPPREPATEQRILEAARAVFLRHGTAGARMQEIAAEAGVNQALVHYYFRTKERLSAAVFQQVASRIFPALAKTLGAEIPIDEKIDRLIAIYLDNLSRSPYATFSKIDRCGNSA